MSDVQPTAATAEDGNLFLRGDTIFGVCEAVGQDLGFNPYWLRVALCFGIFLSPEGVIGAYLVLGLFVAASRFLFRSPRTAPPAELAESSADGEEQEMPLAA